MTPIRAAIVAAAEQLAQAGIDSARTDAELLAAHVAGTERGRLALLDSPEVGFFERFDQAVTARASRIPLQHITGRAAFGPADLQVGPGVFIPRPETEALLDWALRQQLPARPVILDLCTGSGALAVALASTIGSTAAAGRLLYALARDGFGPKPLGVLSKHGVPGNAVTTVVVLSFALCAGLGFAGVGAFDAYYWYATIAVLCMLVAYSVASAGVIYFTLKGKNTIPKWEIVIPVLGIGYLLYVYTQQLGAEFPYTLFPWIAGAWCVIGLLVIFLAPSIAQRVGAHLTEELGEADTAPAGKES